jgi:F0F1-type ATP synthase assembly protein I
MGSDEEKLDALSERIAKAQIASEAKPESPSTVVSSSGAGFDFAGSVVGSGIVGALMDRAFNTSPWCLLGMVIFGFGIGTFSAWRSMQKSENENKK